jgi:hypothetical protein
MSGIISDLSPDDTIPMEVDYSSFTGKKRPCPEENTPKSPTNDRPSDDSVSADAIKNSFDVIITKLHVLAGKSSPNSISLDDFNSLCDSIAFEFRKHFPSTVFSVPKMSISPALTSSAEKVDPRDTHTPTQPRTVPSSVLPKPKKSFAEIARSAVQSCDDASSKSKIALQHVVARRSSLPMRQRLLPLEAKLHDKFEERLDQTKFVYFRGIQRISYSDLRFLFQSMGFQYRELLHFSFLGSGITSVLCQDKNVASRLISLLCSDKNITEVSIEDPSLPLPQKHHSSTDFSTEFIAQCRQSYIARVSREILLSRDLLVSTALQRQVPSCADAITSMVRLRKRDSFKSGVAKQ